MMYSLEEVYRITGDNTFADLLERVTFNALPTQITDKGDARQYYQQVNQVEVTRKARNFSTPHQDTDILFGVLSGYPCCTCNLHQGWPKFVQNLWLKTKEGGIAAMVYAPSTLSTNVNGVDVVIDEQTCYPFEEQIAFSFSFPDKKQKSAEFPFELRVPAWSNGYTLTVNDAEVKAEDVRRGTIRLSRTWADGDKVVITFNAKVAITRWYDYSAVVERGPLVYALRMEEKWKRHECVGDDIRVLGPYYYEVTSTTPWNVALRGDDVKWENWEKSFTVEKGECSNTPWTLEGAPIKIKAKARMLPNWGMHRNSAGQINYLTQIEPRGEVGPEVDITLIPYGCTTLRLTEFPVR